MSRMKIKGRSSLANTAQTSSKPASRWQSSRSLCRGLVQHKTTSQMRPTSRVDSSLPLLTRTWSLLIRRLTAFSTCFQSRISTKRLSVGWACQGLYPHARIDCWYCATTRRRIRVTSSESISMALCQAPCTIVSRDSTPLENCKRINWGLTISELSLTNLVLHHLQKFGRWID